MSDDTYYTVLNVAETASLCDIKTAYRDLIRQVHPDTISDLAPYLRHVAEEKAKEITEAYSVLSSPSKRREYDAQLAVYRRQTNAHTAPPPHAQEAASQSSSGASDTAATSQQANYDWAFFKRWSQEHPILAFAISGFFLWLIATLVQFFLRSSSPSDERWTT